MTAPVPEIRRRLADNPWGKNHIELPRDDLVAILDTAEALASVVFMYREEHPALARWRELTGEEER